MSFGGPQFSPSQQGIDSSHSPSRSGEESGKVRKELYTPKEIGKKIFKLASKALKRLSGQWSVQKVDPSTVKGTPGLKSSDSSVKPLSFKTISERGIQSVDVPTKLNGNAPLPRSDFLTSIDSGLEEGDDISITSTDNYAPIKTDSSDDGYTTIRSNDVSDINEFEDPASHYALPSEIKSSTPPVNKDLENEPHYQNIDSKAESPDTSEVDEGISEPLESTHGDSSTESTDSIGSNSENDSGGSSSDDNESQQSFSQEPEADEPTESSTLVHSRKYQAYESVLLSGNTDALKEKLANTNSYQTAKNVTQMALNQSGGDKTAPMFKTAQNRVQELKADQLFNELGGYAIGADYDQIREDARKSLASHYPNETYRQHVFEKLDAQLKEYEARFEGETPFSHIPPPIPEYNPDIEEIIPQEEVIEEMTSKEEVQETPTKQKKRNRRNR